jgi:hypothetical protein
MLNTHRIDLTKKLLKILPASEIKALTMDRKFVGIKWLQWLESQNIGSVVRIKKNGWVGAKTAEQRVRSRGDRPKGLMSIFGSDPLLWVQAHSARRA